MQSTTPPIRLLLATIVPVLLFASSIRAESDKALEQYLEELGKRSSTVGDLRVRFRQEKKLRLVRRPRVSTAELVFSKGRLSVTTRAVTARGTSGAVDTRLLVHDGEMKIFYPSLSPPRLEIYPATKTGAAGPSKGAEAGRRAMLPLFSGDWKSLAKSFELSMGKRDLEVDGKTLEATVLTLLPRAKDASIRKLEVVLVDYRIREYSQVERGGHRVRMQILEWESQARVDDSAFELRIPEGTKIVRPVG